MKVWSPNYWSARESPLFANFSSQTLNSLIFRFFLPTYAFMTINHILSSTQSHVHYRLLFFYYLALSILKFPLWDFPFNLCAVRSTLFKLPDDLREWKPPSLTGPLPAHAAPRGRACCRSRLLSARLDLRPNAANVTMFLAHLKRKYILQLLHAELYKNLIDQICSFCCSHLLNPHWCSSACSVYYAGGFVNYAVWLCNLFSWY